MPALHPFVQALATSKEKQLIVFKDYNENEVGDAVEKHAAETGRPVRRVHLSKIVNKYLGETEKNLQAVLEGANGSGAILFFDEADALFGKRTEVKDAHDRYTNRKAAYLLQKLEAYNGLAVVAVNRKKGSGKPFLRRYRYLPVA